MIKEVIFDIETRKLFDQIPDRNNIADLGVSVVSAYRRDLDDELKEIGGELKSFWPADTAGMPTSAKVLGFDELWGWMQSADRVIGFNSVRFDAPVLVPHYQGDIFKLPHFDILDEIKKVLGFRIGLGALAKETLGEKKMADGLAAVDWWNKGDAESLKNLAMYCEQDVVVTKNLYDFALKNKRLKFKDKWNDLKEFEVDFGYPVKEEEPQLGLF